VPIISYIHELSMVTQLCTTPEALEKVFLYTKHFLADSEAVKKFLMLEHYVPAQAISIVKSYTPPAEKATAAAVKQFAIEKKLTASFIVGAIAQPQWRKGTEIFILVAAQVFKNKPDAAIQFAWMGGLKHYMNYMEMAHDIERMQLKDKVLLIETTAEIHLLLDNADLFFLSSREDPYPLVVLDAASAGVPTVCFKNAGGAPDFVAEDAGTVVDYLDIEAMADAIIHYYDNPGLLQQHGARAAHKVAEIHQDKDAISCQFFDVFAAVQGTLEKGLPA